MTGHGIHSGGTRTMFSVSLSEVTSTQTARESQRPPASAEAAPRSAATGARRSNGPAGALTPQYSVWPRSRRNWRTEKTRIIAKSTHAIAEAAPNWKKFWKAVS